MAKTLIEESGRKCFSCKKDRADGAFVIKGQEAILSNNMTHFTIKDKTESRVYDADGVKLK